VVSPGPATLSPPSSGIPGRGRVHAMTPGPPKAVRPFGASLTLWCWKHKAAGPVVARLEIGECGIHTAGQIGCEPLVAPESALLIRLDNW